jgi:EmrB/QacA subfamily drug resistance transporter
MTPTPPAPHERWVLLASILASSMAFIDSFALSSAIPRIQADLRMDGSQVLWVTLAYTLPLAALILVGGSLGDHFGRKRVFMIGIILFAAASLICGLAPSVEVLIAARMLQGIGGALLTPGSLALIAATYPSDRRGQAIGTWSTFTTAGTLLGPILGGVLAEAGLWRWIFFINLPFAAITLFLLSTRVPESRDSSSARQLDWPGIILATSALSGLTYSLTEGSSLGWGHPLVLVTGIGGLIALVAFVLVQQRSPHPMVPLTLFQSRSFSGINLMTFFLYGGLAVVPVFTPLLLIQVQGYRADQASLVSLPTTIILALMSRWAGGLADRIGPRTLLTVGPVIIGIGFLWYGLQGMTGGFGTYWTTYFPAALLMGIGLGITVAPLTATVMGAAPAHSSGIASGINNAVARTGSVLTVAILGGIALAVFSSTLAARTQGMEMPAAAQSELMSTASRLAETVIPASLSSDMQQSVQAAVHLAFIDTFRLIAITVAVLAWLSAAIAFFWIPANPAR